MLTTIMLTTTHSLWIQPGNHEGSFLVDRLRSASFDCIINSAKETSSNVHVQKCTTQTSGHLWHRNSLGAGSKLHKGWKFIGKKVEECCSEVVDGQPHWDLVVTGWSSASGFSSWPWITATQRVGLLSAGLHRCVALVTGDGSTDRSQRKCWQLSDQLGHDVWNSRAAAGETKKADRHDRAKLR